MKGLFQSKIVWLGILGIISAGINGFTKIEIDPAINEQIVALDWSNIGQAALSAATIVARWFFTNVPISTLRSGVKEASDEFSPN
jgi:hypothetical protein